MKRAVARYLSFLGVPIILGGCDLYPKIMNIGSGASGADYDAMPDAGALDGDDVVFVPAAGRGATDDLYAPNPDAQYGRPVASDNLYDTGVRDDIRYVSAEDYSSTRTHAIIPDATPVKPARDQTSNDGYLAPRQVASPYLAKEKDDVLLVPARVAAPSKVTVVDPFADEITVKKGDTVFAISKRYDVPLRDLMDANNISPPYTITVGRKLKLPAARYHTVKSGETLYSVSRAYSVDLNSLVRENNLKEPYGLAVGQKLKLPGRVIAQEIPAPPFAAVTPPAKTTVAVGTLTKTKPVAAVRPTVTDKAKVSSTTPSGTVSKLPRVTARASTKFSWPVRGKILSAFGAKTNGLYNDGINIGATAGTTVRSAENGVVAYAGNELKGMGNLVIVQHSGGWMTVYAHMDNMAVKRGTKLSVGQKIGAVGRTGKVSEPQLHFEIRKGTKAYNPTSQLKK